MKNVGGAAARDCCRWSPVMTGAFRGLGWGGGRLVMRSLMKVMNEKQHGVNWGVGGGGDHLRSKQHRYTREGRDWERRREQRRRTERMSGAWGKRKREREGHKQVIVCLAKFFYILRINYYQRGRCIAIKAFLIGEFHSTVCPSSASEYWRQLTHMCPISFPQSSHPHLPDPIC